MDNPHNVDLRRHSYRALAAVVTWLVVSLAYLSPITPGQWGADKWTGLVGVLLFAAAVFIAIRQASAYSLVIRYAALIVAALAMLLMVVANPSDIVFILAIIFAAILPEYFSLKRAAIVQLTLHCLLTLAYLLRWGDSDDFIAGSLLWLTFQTFALLSSQIATEERRARQELEFSHHQLEATQNMLAATSRQDERLRISRDIHDVMGHHLTGLSLQLEVASHGNPEKAQAHIAQAQLITKLLLSDVRQVVNDMRAIDQVDLAESLRSLTANTGRTQVELQLPDKLAVHDTRIAEAVFRTVQEIVTNAVRHSSGYQLNIHLTEEDGILTINASDDGPISKLPEPGNGMKGMRERIEALGGRVSFLAADGMAYNIQLSTRPR